MAVAVASHWLPLFEEFVRDIRINSKEESNPDGNGTPLVLWESQKRFMRELAMGLDDGVRTFYAAKSRQLGITTVSLAIDVFWLSMHPGIVGALVTEDEQNRDKNRTVLQKYIESFPVGYFGYENFIVKNNRLQMTFANGSRLDFKVAGTKKKSTAWGEGEGYSFAHLTEVASYGDMDGLRSFEESFAQKNPARLFVYESTSKGFNLWRDKFYSGYDDPETKRSFFIGWWANPMNSIEPGDPRFAKYGLEKSDREEKEKIRAVWDRYQWEVTPEQLAWHRWRAATDDAGADMLAQNQPWTVEESFVTSGHSFFQTRLITSAMRKMEEETHPYLAYAYDFGDNFFEMKLRTLDDDAYSEEIQLKVWEEPQLGAKYVLGCDPAWGRTDHKDGTAISIWRCYADVMVQVAEFLTNDLDVKYVAWVLAHLGGAYGDVILNVELGGGGRIIMHEWANLKNQINSEVYNKYTKSGQWEDALDNARWYLYSRPDSMGAGYAYNFEVTWRTKQEIMHGFRGAFVTNEISIRSKRLLFEMSNVIQDGSTIGAPDSSDPNSKDDRVFAAAFAHRAWVNWVRPGMIANGDLYEIVHKKETGQETQSERMVNGLIHRFFVHQAVNAEYRQPTWRDERNL